MDIDAPTFYLDNKHAPLRVDHKKISFSIALPPPSFRLPTHMVQDDPIIW